MAHVLEHADRVEEWLLGDIQQGPGLLRRAGALVVELTRMGGPGFVSASVMGAGSQKHESDPTQDADKVIDLLVMLYEWRGKGIGEDTDRVRAKLVAKLRDYRVTDAEALLGSPRTGKGALELIRREIRGALSPPVFPSELERCYGLAWHLRDWIGDTCDHDFQLLGSDDIRIRVMVCTHDCGAKYALGEHDVWLPL